jgi:signal transduction histidine kinase
MTAVLALLRGVPVLVWVVVVALVWGGIQHRRAGSQAKARAVAEQAAAVAAATEQAQAAAREREQALSEATRKAADDYRTTLAAAQRRAAGLRDERDRLLDAVAATPQACPARPGAAAASGVDGTAGLRIVVAECITALQQVAEAADTSDAKLRGLQDYVKATRP